MANPFVGGRWSPIGVDFDSRFIKAAQLTRSRGGWRLAAAMRLPRLICGATLDPQEAPRFARVLDRQRFRGKQIVVAVPEDKLVAGVLELPPRSSGAPLEEIARAELSRMHNYPLADAETLCWDLPDTGRHRAKTQVMAVGCRHADAEAFLEVFESAGLKPCGLESRLHALVRACRPIVPATATTALLDLEWDGALLILLYQGTVIYRMVVPEASFQNLATDLAHQLDMEGDLVDYLLSEVGLNPSQAGRRQDDVSFEAVAGLIRKHLDMVAEAMQSPLSYAAHQHADAVVGDVLLTGLGAAIPGAAAYLEPRLGVTVRPVRPADLVPCEDAAGGGTADPALAVAIGLAQFQE